MGVVLITLMLSKTLIDYRNISQLLFSDVQWCVMCNKQCKHCGNELGSHCTVGHGRPPGRLLDVAATFRLTRERRPHTAQGGEVLAEDNVSLDACVSDVVSGCCIANGNGRHGDTSSTVNDCRYSREETEKYVGTFAIFSSILSESDFVQFIFQSALVFQT